MPLRPSRSWRRVLGRAGGGAGAGDTLQVDIYIIFSISTNLISTASASSGSWARVRPTSWWTTTPSTSATARPWCWPWTAAWCAARSVGKTVDRERWLLDNVIVLLIYFLHASSNLLSYWRIKRIIFCKISLLANIIYWHSSKFGLHFLCLAPAIETVTDKDINFEI